MEDRHILELLWDRAESAIDALRAKFGRRPHMTAMNILGNAQDAEEAINDTYLALLDAIPPARPDPLPAFVYKVGRNVALKFLRLRSAQKRNSGYDLSLEELGITDVFDKTRSDFTSSISTTPVWVDTVKQAARVTIDEEGVVAASYIVIPGAGAGMPPEEIIDFVLDRPFLFVIESDGIPLFTGVVNNP